MGQEEILLYKEAIAIHAFQNGEVRDGDWSHEKILCIKNNKTLRFHVFLNRLS